MTPGPSVSRRRLLRDLGIAGVATSSLAFVTSRGSVAYTESAVTQTEAGADLRIEWAETYNGSVLESGATDPDPETPIVSLTNVLPGDEGTLALRVTMETASPADQTYAITMLSELVGEAENGVTEPEAKAGDVTPDQGELGDNLHVQVWYDDGLLGGCDGAKDIDERVVAEGSLRAVASVLSSGVPLVTSGGDGCFGEGDAVCLGLRWSLPDGGPADNVYQSDSATIDLSFGAIEC